MKKRKKQKIPKTMTFVFAHRGLLNVPLNYPIKQKFLNNFLSLGVLKGIVTIMKKFVLMMSMIVCFALSGCQNNNSSTGKTETTPLNSEITSGDSQNTADEITTATVAASNSITDAELSAAKMNVAEFKDLLSGMPLKVISTKYVVQDENYKALYPDMLQAVIQNDTNLDIKNAVVAFAAWDSNNLPVKIKGNMDFSSGTYIRRINYNDINLAPNSTYGESSGYGIDDGCKIDSFEAIVVSYETFDGTKWNNPYYNEWEKLFEGVKLSDDLTVEVVIKDSVEVSENKKDDTTNKESEINAESLQNNIDLQEVKIVSTKYVVQDEKHKALYPDMLQAVIQNDTSFDIKNAVIAFAAWDSNNLPVKIKGNMDFSGGAYIKQVNYNDINLVPNSTFGESSGFSVDENCNIETFKAIVVSYEAFSGETWKNPYYNDWCKLYEGVKLS